MHTAFLKMSINVRFFNHFLVRDKEVDRLLLAIWLGNYYFTMYLPAVKYSLSVTTMTMKELHSVQSLMTAVTLNKFGYHRNYPHAVVFAPIRLFGCGMCDLRIEQGLAQINALLDYIGTSHKIGNVMSISLRSLQVEADISSNILAVPSKELTYVTDCWFLGLHKFCATHRIRIHVKANRVPSSARQHDQFIMDIAPPQCLLNNRSLWTSTLSVFTSRYVLSATLQLQLAAQFISLLGKSNPSAIAGAIFHFPIKKHQRPVKEDYGAKFFIIFYVPNHRQQTYV